MKILLLNHEFPPIGGGGGRVCYELARQFVKKDHSATVVSTSFRDLPRKEKVEGVNIHRVYGSRKSNLDNNVPITAASFLLWGTRLARKLIHEQAFDLIHAFFSVPAGMAGSILKRQTGLPLIVSPHGSDVPHHNPEKFNLPIRFLSPLIARIWQDADRVITVSNGLKHTMQKTVPNLSCQVIYNGIDLKHFNLVSPLSPNNKCIELVTVGRLVRLKGIQNLLEALALLKREGFEFRLRVAGEGNFRTELQRLTNKRNLSDRVRFVGHIPYADLPTFYNSAHIFVLPSLAESFGQVFVEAMACGLPVIGSTAGGIPEVVGPHQQAWLTEPGNSAQIAEKLRALIKNSELRQDLGKKNIAYVTQHFHWSDIADTYLAAYQHVMKSPNRPDCAAFALPIHPVCL